MKEAEEEEDICENKRRPWRSVSMNALLLLSAETQIEQNELDRRRLPLERLGHRPRALLEHWHPIERLPA